MNKQDTSRAVAQWHKRDELSKWLSRFPWDYFVTVTARHELTEASARRVVDAYLNRVARAGDLGARWRNEDYDGRLMWVAEPHKRAGGGYHLHCLVKLPKRFDALGGKTAWAMTRDGWRAAVGGPKWRNKKGKLGHWHRVQVKTYKGYTAAEYCAKYITKSMVDWDFMPIL